MIIAYSPFVRYKHCIQNGKEIQTISPRLPFLEWASGGSQKDECRKCFAGIKNNAQDLKSWTAIRHLVPPIVIRLLFAMLK